VAAIILVRIGWNLREYSAIASVKRMREDETLEVLEQELEEIKKKYLPIKIEKVEHGYFVYSLPDNTFMAQGSNRKELEDNLDKRYPGKKFAATPDNLKEVGFDS
jgi:predicted RNase H-like HicB family nuclease